MFKATVLQENVESEYTDNDVNRLLFCIMSMHVGLLLHPKDNVFTVKRPSLNNRYKSLNYTITMFADGKPMPTSMMWTIRKTYIEKRIEMKKEKEEKFLLKRSSMQPKEYEYVKREPTQFKPLRKTSVQPSQRFASTASSTSNT